MQSVPQRIGAAPVLQAQLSNALHRFRHMVDWCIDRPQQVKRRKLTPQATVVIFLPLPTETSPPPANEVIHGDCHELLPTLPEGLSQIVFIDPPYNFAIDYGDGKEADRLEPTEYLRQMSSLILESVRTLTETGSLWFLCPEQWADQIGTMLSDKLPRRNRIIWRETFGQYHEHRFPSGHRHLFWHVKDPDRTPFYTDDIRVPSARMQAGDSRAKGPRVPDDVWEIPRLVGNAKERLGDHPCQLPEELLRRVILCSTSPDDLVLDPTAGTGTTLRVAQQLGRRYLGIEQQGRYVELIRARLRQSYQRALFAD